MMFVVQTFICPFVSPDKPSAMGIMMVLSDCDSVADSNPTRRMENYIWLSSPFHLWSCRHYLQSDFWHSTLAWLTIQMKAGWKKQIVCLFLVCWVLAAVCV